LLRSLLPTKCQEHHNNQSKAFIEQSIVNKKMAIKDNEREDSNKKKTTILQKPGRREKNTKRIDEWIDR